MSIAASHPHWLFWQLLDSAFPTGGFAHSGGLEAAWQHGMIRGGDDLLPFVRAALTQCSAGLAPLVCAVATDAALFDEVDAYCEAALSNHVARRASRAQGRAMLATAATTFESTPLTDIADRVRKDRLPGHLPPVFGRVAGEMGVAVLPAASAFLFMTARGMLSAAVRLGVVGPLEGQRLQAAVATDADRLAQNAVDRPWRQITQTTPMLDLLQATQDRLYSRLFQS